MEDKLFTLAELQNLLSSTSHYHRLYALNMVNRMIQANCKSGEDHFVKQALLNPKLTNLSKLLSLSLQTATRLDFAKTHLEIIESILKGIFEDDRRIYCVANLETAKRLQAAPKQEYFLMDFITELPDSDKSGIVNLIGTFSDSTGNPLFSKVLHLAAKLLGQDPEDATVLGVVGYM